MTNTQPTLNTVPIAPQLSDLLNLLKREIFIDLNCHHLGTIQSFDGNSQTAEITVNYTKTIYTLPANSQVTTPMQMPYPLLQDVPVIVMGGGGFNLTFPIAQGDQCLVMFNDRSLDNWFQSGLAGPLNSNRAHSLSDGIALVGLNYLTGTGDTTGLTGYDTSRAVLRYKNNACGVGVGASKVKIFNSATTLNTLLQNILTQLETLAATVAVSGSPLNPAVASQLAVLATELGTLLE